jgi:hypothetical protein
LICGNKEYLVSLKKYSYCGSFACLDSNDTSDAIGLLEEVEELTSESCIQPIIQELLFGDAFLKVSK